jgi:hypothetical protein
MAAQTSPKKTLKAFLIFRAHDSNLRVVTRRPNLEWDEIAFDISVTVPQPWGRLAGSIVVELPENGPAYVEVTTDATRP